jgi:hypothetical protein
MSDDIQPSERVIIGESIKRDWHDALDSARSHTFRDHLIT